MPGLTKPHSLQHNSTSMSWDLKKQSPKSKHARWPQVLCCLRKQGGEPWRADRCVLRESEGRSHNVHHGSGHATIFESYQKRQSASAIRTRADKGVNPTPKWTQSFLWRGAGRAHYSREAAGGGDVGILRIRVGTRACEDVLETHGWRPFPVPSRPQRRGDTSPPRLGQGATARPHTDGMPDRALMRRRRHSLAGAQEGPRQNCAPPDCAPPSSYSPEAPGSPWASFSDRSKPLQGPVLAGCVEGRRARSVRLPE